MHGGSSVKLTISKWTGLALFCAVSVVLLAALRFGSSTATSDIHVKQDVKVAGVILSRDGDMVRIKTKNPVRSLLSISLTTLRSSARNIAFCFLATPTWM